MMDISIVVNIKYGWIEMAMAKSDLLRRAYDLGYADYQWKLPLSSCPYSMTSDGLRTHWQRGWLSAQRDKAPRSAHPLAGERGI